MDGSGSSSNSSKIASVGTATLGGAQVVLTIIEKLMDSIPLPFVKGAAGAAVEVIKMARVIHSNRKECSELVNRSTSLLIVILSSLKGKTANEIPDDLKQAVERLAIDFQEVLSELQIVNKRAGKKTITGPFRAVVYHQDNLETLKGCCAKLDWAMQVFQVTSKVESCLRDLEHHEMVIKSQVELKDGLAELRDAMVEGINNIMDAMKDKDVENTISSLPSIRIPPNPKIFGRTEYVATAVKLLLREESGRLAILGPGGMGKTSTALKIAYDPNVVRRFGKNIHWVPCEQATHLPLLVELLAKSLHLSTKSSNDRLSDVATTLESSDDPHLFLLDNFETPWDIPMKQSDVADILSHLGSISSVSLILTMRGTEYPAPGEVEWSTPPLPILTPLELAAAREAFLKIAPNAAGDSDIDAILKELDYIPLAITLMAKLLSQGEPLSELLLQWKSEKTGLLAQPDGDRRSCIEVSIRLSLESRAVRVMPEAIQLLSVLSFLPAGACITSLPQICPSIPNQKKALRILHNAALVYKCHNDTFVQVLSPIRSYILLHKPLNTTLLHDLRSAYCQLAKKWPGDGKFHANMEAFAQEEVNIEFILLDMLKDTSGMREEALEASLDYFSYCFQITLETTVIRSAVHSACVSGSPLLPRCLQLLGKILYMQSRYDEAKAALEEARTWFITLGNQIGAAQCIRSLGDMLHTQSRYDEAKVVLEEARAKFTTLGNQIDAAECLQSLGTVLYMQSRYDEAKAALEEARAQFIALRDQTHAAQCLGSLGDVLRMQNRYDEAEATLEEARAQFITLGEQIGAAQCLELLGHTLLMQGRYDEAKATLEEARDMLITLGNQMGAARCLQSLGNILCIQNRNDEAKAALEEAQAKFIILEDQLGAAQCLWSLGDTLRMQSRYDEAKAALEEARAKFITMENQTGVAQCLWSLGEVLFMQSRYGEAKAALEEARAKFIATGSQLGVAQCESSLEELTQMQSDS